MALTISNIMKWTPRISTAAFWLTYILVGLLLNWQHSLSSDEGITLTAAWNVSRGLVPYRDFFDFYTPGSFYVLGAAFTVFGAQYIVARITAIILLLSGGYGLWLGTRTWLPRWLQPAVPFLWLILFAYYPLINHNTFSLMASVWAWVALQTAERRGNGRAYMIAGVAAGITVWMLQTKGAAVIAAAMVVTLLYYRVQLRRFGWYILGVLVSLLPMLAWPLSLLWSSLVIFPLQHYQTVSEFDYSFIIVVLGIHVLLGLGLWVRNASRTVWSLWWLSVFLVASSWSLPDLHHVVINTWAAIPLVLWLLSSREIRSPRWRAAGWISAVLPSAYVVALAGVLVATAPSLLPWRQGKTFSQWLRMADPGNDALVSLIQRRVTKEQTIYAGPFIPNLYFETQRKNATRFSHLITTLHPPKLFDEARRELEAHPPALVVLNYQLVEKYGYSIDNPVDEYIWENYHPVEENGDLLILAPNLSE